MIVTITLLEMKYCCSDIDICYIDNKGEKE